MTYTPEKPLKLSEVPGFKELIVSLKDWTDAETGEQIDDDPNFLNGTISFLHLDEIKEIGKDEKGKKGKYIIFRLRDDEHDGTHYTKAYIMDYWIESAKGRWATGVEFINL